MEENYAHLLPMNLSSEFVNIIRDATSVLFTGGTMEPSGLLENLIFGEKRKIVKKAFGHVVSPENILLTPVGSYGGKELVFNYKNSENDEILEKTSMLILEIFYRTPGGTIVFLTSYKVLNRLKA